MEKENERLNKISKKICKDYIIEYPSPEFPLHYNYLYLKCSIINVKFVAINKYRRAHIKYAKD